MKTEIKYALYLIGLGMSLLMYAHAEFSTKKEVDSLKTVVDRIDQRVYDIHKAIR